MTTAMRERTRPSANNMDAKQQPDGDPPYVLVAVALLWIGMAMDHYLPTLWLLVAETVMAGVVVAVLGVRWMRRLRR